MPLDSLFVLTVAAASLLSGIGCPLVAWLAFKRVQARLQQFGERRFGELTQQLKALEVRLERFEGIGTTPSAEARGSSLPESRSRDGLDRHGRRRVSSNDATRQCPESMAASVL